MVKLLLWALIGYLGYRVARGALVVWKVTRNTFPPFPSARREGEGRRPVEAEFEVEEKT